MKTVLQRRVGNLRNLPFVSNMWFSLGADNRPAAEGPDRRQPCASTPSCSGAGHPPVSFRRRPTRCLIACSTGRECGTLGTFLLAMNQWPWTNDCDPRWPKASLKSWEFERMQQSRTAASTARGPAPLACHRNRGNCLHGQSTNPLFFTRLFLLNRRSSPRVARTITLSSIKLASIK